MHEKRPGHPKYPSRWPEVTDRIVVPRWARVGPTAIAPAFNVRARFSGLRNRDFPRRANGIAPSNPGRSCMIITFWNPKT